jgi:hypothetical protein
VDDAERRVGEAVEISRRGGFVGAEPWFVAHLGWIARLQGRWDVAVEHGRSAVEQTRRVPQAWFGPSAEALLAGTLLQLGDTAGAVGLLHDALRHSGSQVAEGYRLRCLAPLAEATGERDVLVEADALLASIAAPPGAAFLLGADVYLSVARAWLRSGEPDRVRTVLAPLLAAAERLRWIPVLVTAGLVDSDALAAQGASTADGVRRRALVLAVEHGMAAGAQPVPRPVSQAALQPAGNAAATTPRKLVPDR